MYLRITSSIDNINILVSLSLSFLILMYEDKKRAINKSWRISESNLICIAIIGGSIGVFCGMNAFRHKTKHNKFSIGVPGIMFLQAILFLMLKS